MYQTDETFSSLNFQLYISTRAVSPKCIFFFIKIYVSNEYLQQIEGWAQDYSNSNIFLKPLFRGNLDPFVNNANLDAIAHMSNGT